MNLSRRIDVGKEFASCFKLPDPKKFAELLSDDVCMEYTRDLYQLSFAGKEQVIQKANELFFEQIKNLVDFQLKSYSLQGDPRNDRVIVKTKIHVKEARDSEVVSIKFLGVHELHVKTEGENFKICKIVSASKSSNISADRP